jgi:hypothetical protein
VVKYSSKVTDNFLTDQLGEQVIIICYYYIKNLKQGKNVCKIQFALTFILEKL